MKLNTTALRDRAKAQGSAQVIASLRERAKELPPGSVVSMRLEDDVLACCDRIDELERALQKVRAFCTGAGTGKPTGDELNICAALYSVAGEALEES